MIAAQVMGSAAVDVWERQKVHLERPCCWRGHAAETRKRSAPGRQSPCQARRSCPQLQAGHTSSLNTEYGGPGCTAASCQAVPVICSGKMDAHAIQFGAQPVMARCAILQNNHRGSAQVSRGGSLVGCSNTPDGWLMGDRCAAPTGAEQEATTGARQRVMLWHRVQGRHLPDVSPCSSKSVLAPVAWRATPLVVGDSVLRVLRALPVSPVLRRLENPEKSCSMARASQQAHCSLRVSPGAAPIGGTRTMLRQGNSLSARQDVALQVYQVLHRLGPRRFHQERLEHSPRSIAGPRGTSCWQGCRTRPIRCSSSNRVPQQQAMTAGATLQNS